ncbi:MAG TPA: helix-turn-helix domain-containing protein [Allosphingosinicella sp.]|nr:helix-turn-helix domain-containing protein [Allosphingosinicella sp.]
MALIEIGMILVPGVRVPFGAWGGARLVRPFQFRIRPIGGSGQFQDQAPERFGDRARPGKPCFQLGDALALTSVHVNRTLSALRDDDLVVASRGVVEILDWQGLVLAAEFAPDYLHLTNGERV